MPSTHGDSPRLSAGFTLVELVMVLTITAIIGAMAVPRYSRSLYRYRVDSAARRVAADLELCRSYAKANSSTQTLVFNTSGSTYTGSFAGFTSSGSYLVSLADSPYRVTLTSVSLTSSNSVSFDGFGKPSITGTIGLTLGGYTKYVAIDSSTSEVSIK
jgi:prepilin-type N-terminal cleavage/methylation domain-containing protein